MCLAIPMKLIKRDGDFGTVEYMGISRIVSLHLIECVNDGDFLIVHAGVAIKKIDLEEAQKTLAIFEEILKKTYDS